MTSSSSSSRLHSWQQPSRRFTTISTADRSPMGLEESFHRAVLMLHNNYHYCNYCQYYYHYHRAIFCVSHRSGCAYKDCHSQENSWEPLRPSWHISQTVLQQYIQLHIVRLFWQTTTVYFAVPSHLTPHNTCTHGSRLRSTKTCSVQLIILIH